MDAIASLCLSRVTQLSKSNRKTIMRMQNFATDVIASFLYSKRSAPKSFPVLFILLLLIFADLSVVAQITNDYRSATSGTWATVATWERYNGSSWVAAT
ncbi:MAG: hypothetical protein ACOVP6_05520, partial [Lacibacter sp.]